MDLGRSFPRRACAKSDWSSNRRSGRSGESAEQNPSGVALNFRRGARKREAEMKMKLAWVIAVRSCAPSAIAGDEAAYPKER
jgi:hypothetical protein